MPGFVQYRSIVVLEVMWKPQATSPFQNYGEFSVSTTGRKLHLRCINSLQPYAKKTMSHRSNSYSVPWTCVTR